MKEKAQNKKRHFEIFSVLVIVATLFMSVAFAEISDIELLINGTITPQIQQGVYIKEINAISRDGVVSEAVNYYSGTTLSTSIELSKSKTSSLIYDITLYNSQSEAYFAGVNYVDEAYSNKNITYNINGLDPYVTIIYPHESVSFTLEFKYVDGFTPSTTQELNSLLNFSFSNTFIEIALGVEADYTVYKNVPEGATWEQWINSEYNEEFTVSKGKVYISNKQVYLKDKEVKNTDVIDDIMYNFKPELTWNEESTEVTNKIGEVVTINSILRLTNVKVDDSFEYSSSNQNILEIESVTLDLQSQSDTDIHFKINCKAPGTAKITANYGNISKTCVIKVTQLKEEYYEGENVRINGEDFYVIEDSDATQKTVLLLAKECIDTTKLLQTWAANKITFSSTPYWDGTVTSYPYNLTETGVPDKSHYATYAAYQYGIKFGGLGRLLTVEEAAKLNEDILFNSENGYLEYWLGTARENYFVDCVDGRSEDLSDDMYNNENGVRPVIELSKSIYENYEIGQKFSIGDEMFYLIENSDISQKNVILLAQEAIDTTNLVQSVNANKIHFSSTPYWLGTAISYPYDLIETGVPDKSHYAAKAAYDYGAKLGGLGRLPTYNEANAFVTEVPQPNENSHFYWVAAAAGDTSVYSVENNPYEMASMFVIDYNGSTSTVRPIIEISKELVTAIEEKNMISFDMYEVSYEAEEGMTWREWIDSSYNNGNFYIDVFGEAEFIFYSLNDEPIGCRSCTRRQRVEYDGEGNYAGVCWNCGDDAFSEFPLDVQEKLIEFKMHGNTFYTEEGMTWREWIDSEYNWGYIYIDTYNGVEYVFCDEFCETIACAKCTRRQFAEYDGQGNKAGYCWNCDEYGCFVEVNDRGELIWDQVGVFFVCGEEFSTEYDMTWSEWIDSGYNIYGIYIGDDGYVYCFDGEPLGCNSCTRRQLAEYDGYGNIAGKCWACSRYHFEEFPFDN